MLGDTTISFLALVFSPVGARHAVPERATSMHAPIHRTFRYHCSPLNSHSRQMARQRRVRSPGTACRRRAWVGRARTVMNGARAKNQQLRRIYALAQACRPPGRRKPTLPNRFFGGSPLLQQRELDFSPAKRHRERIVALATEILRPGAKARDKLPLKFRSAKALLPRMNAGAPTCARNA